MVGVKKLAVIVAAGKGSRLGESLPKQFLMLSGKPVLHWTIQRFYEAGSEVTVVLHSSMLEFWQQLAVQNDTPPHKCIVGGEERFHSVKNAVNAIEDQLGVVAIHDAARPNISSALIDLLFENAQQYQSAIPYTLPADTVRIRREEDTQLVERTEVMMIQTPQCFWLADLKEAYQQDYRKSFTDDATVMEDYLTAPLHFVEGEKLNFKITHPSDWEIMQKIFKP